MDNILFDEGKDEGAISSSDISLDSEIGKDTTEEENADTTSEVKDESSQTDKTESITEDDIKNDEEEINLDSLFAEIDDANDAIEKIEDNKNGDNSSEVRLLKQSLNNMEQMIKKLSNEKADLIYKNAELEAFGLDGTDPQILLLSKNLTKSKNGDEKSKTKTISILKDILYDLTGEDYDKAKIDKDIDLLSATESYNSVSHPNLKSGKKQEEDGLSL